MPDNKEISALTTAEQTSNNDLFETSIPNAMTDTGYISRKQSVTMLEQQMLGNTQYNTELPNFTAGNRTIFKALEEARSSGGGGGASANEALPYDSTDSYSWGDYCIYNNYLWRCTSTSGATGNWDATKWVAVMVTDEYMRVRVMNTSAYNQLSSAEKAGAIFVTDYQSKIQDIDNVSLTTSDDGKLLGVNVSGSDISVVAVFRDVRSTTEKRVGTWINGKPLYEKVISFTNSASSTSDYVQVEQIANLEMATQVNWTFKRVTGSNTFWYTGSGASNPEIDTQYSNYKIAFRVHNGWLEYGFVGYAGYWLTDCYVRVQYTKTTD